MSIGRVPKLSMKIVNGDYGSVGPEINRSDSSFRKKYVHEAKDMNELLD